MAQKITTDFKNSLKAKVIKSTTDFKNNLKAKVIHNKKKKIYEIQKIFNWVYKIYFWISREKKKKILNQKNY